MYKNKQHTPATHIYKYSHTTHTQVQLLLMPLMNTPRSMYVVLSTGTHTHEPWPLNQLKENKLQPEKKQSTKRLLLESIRWEQKENKRKCIIKVASLRMPFF